MYCLICKHFKNKKKRKYTVKNENSVISSSNKSKKTKQKKPPWNYSQYTFPQMLTVLTHARISICHPRDVWRMTRGVSTNRLLVEKWTERGDIENPGVTILIHSFIHSPNLHSSGPGVRCGSWKQGCSGKVGIGGPDLDQSSSTCQPVPSKGPWSLRSPDCHAGSLQTDCLLGVGNVCLMTV